MARDRDPVQRSKYNKCGKSWDTSGDRSCEPGVKSRATVQCSTGLGYRGSGRRRAQDTWKEVTATTVE